VSAQWEKAYLTLALPKGRLFGDSLKALESAKIDCSILAGESSDDRKLVFHDPENALRFLVARSQDVPTYVQFGAADLGIVGRDVLDEGEFDVCVKNKGPEL
jgi:ATP phosphoribosyltransferase